MDRDTAQRADGVLLTILELVTDGVRSTLDEQAALDLGVSVIDEIRHTFGGELVYIGKGRKMDSIILSSKIWKDFNGNNHYQLSKKYDCSIQWVYTVVRAMSKLKGNEVQSDLFESEEVQNVN